MVLLARSFARMAKTELKTVVFLGSARDQAPFWGPKPIPERLGDRVLKYVLQEVKKWPENKNKKDESKLQDVKFDVTHVFDPREVYDHENGALGGGFG